MGSVAEYIALAIFHIDSEIAESDPSQTPGMVGRANRLKAMLNVHKNDHSQASRRDVTAMLKNTQGAPDVEARVAGLWDEDHRPHLRLQEWVGRGV